MNVWPRISRPTNSAGALVDIASGDGGDPGSAGEVVAIPSGTVAVSVITVGTGLVLIRAQSGDDISGGNAPDATNCHAYAAGTTVGPFRVDASADTHIVVAEHAGAAITAYVVNFYRA